MQDIHSIGGGGGRLFSGGGGGVATERRLRPHHHHHHQNHHALKCPRCDSLNTKFCYYNNYNLSQPRHFCKSCRRYWTKGGVLRNVPVGGGCRKTKRSKPKQNTSSTITDSTASTTTTTTPQQQNRLPPEDNQNKSSNSRSSSESSSLTATNNTAANTAVEAASVHSVSSVSKLFALGNMNPSFETALLEQGSNCGIFSEIGSFTSLITSTNDLPFGFNNIVNQQHQQQQQQCLEHGQNNYQNQQQWQNMQHQQQGITGGLIDQSVQVELSGVQNNRGSNGGGFGALDWEGNGDEGGGLFDFPNAVDHAYWGQSQWNDQDHPSLYLP